MGGCGHNSPPQKREMFGHVFADFMKYMRADINLCGLTHGVFGHAVNISGARTLM